MKRTITISVIILFIIVFSLISLFSLKSSKDYVFSELDSIEYHLTQNDFDTAYDKAVKINKYWKDKSNIFSSYIKHNNIDTSMEHLIQLKASIKIKDTENSLLEIENIKFYLNKIYESELPILRNVL